MKKIVIFLPDGIGLRNFVFGNFNKILPYSNISFTYWNNTKYPINIKTGFNEIKISNPKNHFLSDLIKRAKSEIELKLSFKKSENIAYLSYTFKNKKDTFYFVLKNMIVKYLVFTNKRGNSIIRLFSKIASYERKTAYYRQSLKTLEQEKPDLLFCTNQRPILAVAPMLAARDLRIPTAVFISSWDNLPKGMLVVEADYYFVWSKHMKQELSHYYPHINKKQIKITGSPQFEGHFDESLIIKKEDFFAKHELDLSKKYILFSGDDVTTSPYDQFYLEDLAQIVREKNKGSEVKLGIIYRRCPVDFTERHLVIVNKFKDVIVCIDPLWKNQGNTWNMITPRSRDNQLLVNTIRYSELVVNVGSSMVFDAVCHNKPCAYINYNTKKGDITKWNIEKIYKFIHFKSMPSQEVVLWLNMKLDYSKIIDTVLKANICLEETKKWFLKINPYPKESSKEISKNIERIIIKNHK
jgi:serine/threonine protein kinase